MFVRVVFGETLDVVVGGGLGTLDIALMGHYILYVVCMDVVARMGGCYAPEATQRIDLPTTLTSEFGPGLTLLPLKYR